MIVDSGNRTEFDTGAVRDLGSGKGRCDLLPLREVAEYIGDVVLDAIASFQETNDTAFLYDALYETDMFTDEASAILEVAIHFEEGCNKYGERNWEKGIPVHRYIDSAIRHYLKYLRGDDDERHDRAFFWNILCCIWEINRKCKLGGQQ